MKFKWLLWKKKGPEPISYCFSLSGDQTVTTYTHNPSTRSTVSLHLEHLHHLRALGVMATVSTTTAEKLDDDDDDDDETAGRVDEQLRAKEWSTSSAPTVTFDCFVLRSCEQLDHTFLC